MRDEFAAVIRQTGGKVGGKVERHLTVLEMISFVGFRTAETPAMGQCLLRQRTTLERDM